MPHVFPCHPAAKSRAPGLAGWHLASLLSPGWFSGLVRVLWSFSFPLPGQNLYSRFSQVALEPTGQARKTAKRLVDKYQLLGTFWNSKRQFFGQGRYLLPTFVF